MITGIKIEFNKKDNNYFENEYSNEIDKYILIIALLETINDICKDNNLDTKEQLEKYIKMGSIDNYIDKRYVITDVLNDEVETIEEDKKIEKLRQLCEYPSTDTYECWSVKEDIIVNKINEIIDYINKGD